MLLYVYQSDSCLIECLNEWKLINSNNNNKEIITKKNYLNKNTIQCIPYQYHLLDNATSLENFCWWILSM